MKGVSFHGFAGGVWFALLVVVMFFAANGHAEQTNSTTDGAQPRYDVQRYEIQGRKLPSPEALKPLFEKHLGASIGLDEILEVAAGVEATYASQGMTNMSVAMRREEFTNGVVSMLVFEGAKQQVLVSGKCCWPVGAEVTPSTNQTVSNAAVTNAPAVAATNAGPHFAVRAYDVYGNSLLSKETLAKIFVKHTGTNVALDEVLGAAKELQMEYHDRGWDTVSVTLPPQSVTNGVFKIRVFEGKLADIRVANNHWYSSNNVMRALPGLHTNMYLNSRLFQPELDRANANQDRQIYPKIAPGPETNTTELVLDVKDRLPVHAKVDFNNQSSPGTPDDRVNSSAVYNNLWQLDHSVGVQYSFSPYTFKDGSQWDFYDKPLVANYSAFYRMPLGAPPSMEEEMQSRPGTFGFNEATRRFELPPASGTPELNFFASRSTIDTGVLFGPLQFITESTNGNGNVTEQIDNQSFTVNEGLGFRLTEPLREFDGIMSSISAGVDYKHYALETFKDTVFSFGQGAEDVQAVTNFESVRYLPMTIRWDAQRLDGLNSTSLGMGYTVNFSDVFNQKRNFENVAGSTHADGNYSVVTASLGRDQQVYKNWRLSLRADGQWANQPLISNEQLGIGGIAGVRGYREGELFGDTGWRVTSEFKTPSHVLGDLGGWQGGRVTVRASVFMDYAEIYLLDPEGRSPRRSLWGTGLSGAASIGHHWEARLMFGIPLLGTDTTETDQVLINFSLSAQF